MIKLPNYKRSDNLLKASPLTARQAFFSRLISRSCLGIRGRLELHLGLGLSLGLFILAFSLLLYNPAEALGQSAAGTETVGPTAQSNTGLTSNQANKGSIRGKVINGTGDPNIRAGSLNEQAVKLERITGSDTTTLDERETKLDQAGNFVFEGLEVGDNYVYYLSTRYAGVTYYLPQNLTLTPAQPVQSAELKVYETTSDQQVVSVTGTTVIVPQVEADSGQIFILEMYSVVNKSDRTFTGTGSKPSSGSAEASPAGSSKVTAGAVPGQASAVSTVAPAAGGTASNAGSGAGAGSGSNPANSVTLRFFLPPGAKGISPASGLDPGDVIETTDGLEITAPILPGENQLVFSYILPYQAETFSFSKRLAYDTPSFRFFTPVSGPSATSSQLKAGQIIEMGQQKLVPLSGQNFKADTQLKVELTGLPLPSSKGTTVTRDTLLKAGTLLVTLIGLVFLVVYARGTHKLKAVVARTQSGTGTTGLSQSQPGDPAMSSRPGSRLTAPEGNTRPANASDWQLERQLLLEKMARLDLNYQKGGFKGSEATYETRRANLKARLTDFWEPAAAGVASGAESPVNGYLHDAKPDPAPSGLPKPLQTVASPADLTSAVSVGTEEQN